MCDSRRDCSSIRCASSVDQLQNLIAVDVTRKEQSKGSKEVRKRHEAALVDLSYLTVQKARNKINFESPLWISYARQDFQRVSNPRPLCLCGT